MDKKRVKIEFWSFGIDKNDLFVAPELNIVRLYGQAYGHPRIQDGHHVSTSVVLNIDYDKGEVETLNTIYILGNIDDAYKKFLDEKGIELPIKE